MITRPQHDVDLEVVGGVPVGDMHEAQQRPKPPIVDLEHPPPPPCVVVCRAQPQPLGDGGEALGPRREEEDAGRAGWARVGALALPRGEEGGPEAVGVEEEDALVDAPPGDVPEEAFVVVCSKVRAP